MSMMSIGTYPRTIESGSGQRMTFLGLGPDGAMEVESDILPGAGPQLHSHPHQRESVMVIEGEIACAGAHGPERRATVGESVAFEPGVPHRFWNPGSNTLRIRGRIHPPMRFEWFMTLLYASMSANGGRPGLFDVAYLARHFADEGTMDGLPALVRRVVLPAAYVIGSATGRYAQFDNVPPSARSGDVVRSPHRGL
ncbi:MAG: cupin domain-containing protein [bacterium]